MKFLLSSLSFVLLAALSSHASLNRGVWFWGDAGSPWGSIAIVGDSAKEDSTVTFLNNKGVKRVYGSYQNRPVSVPGTIANWNVKLHTADIESQCLFSDNGMIFPSTRWALLDKIEERVMYFNFWPTPRPTAERFDAIHLDLEPQALSAWDTATASEKRDMLMDLRDTYEAIRLLVVAWGYPGFPIYADLATWFDKNPGQIGWLDDADRDQWYADIMTHLTGVTYMAFEQPSIVAVQNSMSWEHANIANEQIRIGHMADVGTTWATVAHFSMMMYSMEWVYGSRAVDIQSYRRWREALFLGIPAVPISVEPALGGSGGGSDGDGEIVWMAGTKGSYAVMESTDLVHWAELRRVDVQQPGRMRTPFVISGPRKFWQVLQISESQERER